MANLPFTFTMNIKHAAIYKRSLLSLESRATVQCMETMTGIAYGVSLIQNAWEQNALDWRGILELVIYLHIYNKSWWWDPFLSMKFFCFMP
jgi:hypothetical protein